MGLLQSIHVTSIYFIKILMRLRNTGGGITRCGIYVNLVFINFLIFFTCLLNCVGMVLIKEIDDCDGDWIYNFVWKRER